MATETHNNQNSTNIINNILFSILKKYFSNGFRLNDYIELLRFRDLTHKEVGRPIKREITDEILTQHISACGTFFEGKIYPVSNEIKKYLKETAEGYFSSGARIIFYEELYEKHRNRLFDDSIISVEMTKYLLKSVFPSIHYAPTYCGYMHGKIPEVINKEISRACNDNIAVDFNQICEQLTYIPPTRIRHTLAQSDQFVYDSENNLCINIEILEIDSNDCDRILQTVMRTCRNDGFIAMADVPLGDLEERNYQLAEAALRLAVFHKCLADSCDRKGKIVSLKGQQLDVRAIMRAHFRKVEHCSLAELEDFAVALDAQPRPDLILDVGNAAMVRVDKDSFVSDELARFDVNGVDAAIAGFVTGDYLPLKAFTAFGTFPDCGYAWNLFLLESYCRRFSRMFRFDALTFNSTNTGAVIRKDNAQSYSDIMVDAVLRSGVERVEKAVGAFLIEHGYIARNSATVREITAAAKTGRERGD